MESWKVFLNVPSNGEYSAWEEGIVRRGEERGGGGSLTRCRENLHRFCII